MSETELLKRAIKILIKIAVEHLKSLPETPWEEFAKRRQQINELEEIERKLEEM